MPLFDNLGKIIIFIAVVYFVFISWGINVTGWLASTTIIAMVLGLAAKDTVANLFAGFFIMADTPYKPGDYINLDGGERGYVKNIGLRSTRIMTRDDIEITIPNALIANSKIIICKRNYKTNAVSIYKNNFSSGYNNWTNDPEDIFHAYA